METYTTNTIHLGKTWLELIQIANFQKSRILWHCCFPLALQKQKHTYWGVRVRRSRRHRLWFKLLVLKHQLLLCRANASLYCNKLLKLGKPEEKKETRVNLRGLGAHQIITCYLVLTSNPRCLYIAWNTPTRVCDITSWFWISGLGCSKGG